jgi:hypothetical protein
MEGSLFRTFGGTGDLDYWLRNCEGFRVERADGGRVGVVEGVRFGSRADRPDVLVVRAGLFGRRELEIAAAAVREVVPREKRVVVASA